MRAPPLLASGRGGEPSSSTPARKTCHDSRCRRPGAAAAERLQDRRPTVSSRGTEARESPPARDGDAGRPPSARPPASESRFKVRSFGFVALTLLAVALCVYIAFPL